MVQPPATASSQAASASPSQRSAFTTSERPTAQPQPGRPGVPCSLGRRPSVALAAAAAWRRQSSARVRLQALEGVEGRPPLKKRPHERHRVLYAIAALVLVGKDLEQANVRTVRV